jgi:hypothetical protein
MKDASYYRKQAANVRERADKATEDDIRARFLDIVARYEALAEEADEALKRRVEETRARIARQ